MLVKKSCTGTESISTGYRKAQTYLNAAGVDSFLRLKPFTLSAKDMKGLRLAPNTKRVSQYTLSSGKKVRVYEISVEDKSFIEKLCKDSEHYMDTQGIASRKVNDKRLIMETNFNIIQEMLATMPKEQKTHMYIAEADSKLCGVLVGGLPKRTPAGEIIYSARKNALPNETELNWFATWPEGNGVGKVLFSEYIRTMERDGFKKMFIQSEIPKLSNASKFYERMGFHKLYELLTERRVSKVEHNKDILDCLNISSSDNALYDYLIIPMLGSRSKLNKIVNDIAEKYHRETFLSPVNAEDFIKEIALV